MGTVRGTRGEEDRIGDRAGGRFFLARISACLTEVLRLVLLTVEVALSISGLNEERFSKLISLASTEDIQNKPFV